MTPELAALDTKVETLRKDVNSQLDGVRQDLKDLTEALRELVRLDGNIKRTDDSVARAHKRLDKVETEFDRVRERLGAMEKDAAVQGKSLSAFERLGWIVFAALASGLGAVFGG